MTDALYKQLEHHYEYFTIDLFQLATICQSMDDLAIDYCIRLEKESASELMDEVIFNSGFLEMIRWKYTASYISQIKEKGIIDYNSKTHYLYNLACNDKAAAQAKKIGFKFTEVDNLLGWELIQVEKNEIKITKTSKINWQEDEVSLAFLFYLLQQQGFLKEKYIYALISNHFTSKGKDIKRESLKSNYNQAKYHDRNENKLPEKAQKLNKIHTRLSDLNELLKILKGENW